MQVGSQKEDQVENQQYQQDKMQQGKEEQHEVREQSQVETLVTSILPWKCVHEAQENYVFLIDQSVMLIGNSHTFEEDDCLQMEDVHANADIMVEFCHFKQTSKQMSKADVETAKQQLQRQGLEDDNSITEEIEDDDVHIGIDKESQILEDVEYDSDSNLDFNSDSVSILDLDTTAILDAKTNSDANFNGSRGKLDEEWMLQKTKDIAANDGVIFGNADGAEFYHGNCQAICQVRNQADDVNMEVEDVQQNANLRIQHNQRSVDQVLDHGKVKRQIQEDFQELARGIYDLIFLIGRILSKFMTWSGVIELDVVKSGAVKKEWNVAGRVEVAVGIQDLQKDLKSKSRILELELQTKLQTKLENAVLQGQGMTCIIVADPDADVFKQEVLEYAQKIKESSKRENEALKIDNERLELAVEVESNVESQADPDFVAEKPVEADAEGGFYAKIVKGWELDWSNESGIYYINAFKLDINAFKLDCLSIDLKKIRWAEELRVIQLFIFLGAHVGITVTSTPRGAEIPLNNWLWDKVPSNALYTTVQEKKLLLKLAQPPNFKGEGANAERDAEVWLEAMDDYFEAAGTHQQNQTMLAIFRLTRDLNI
ncbi:hypothetical protein L7F22_035065 [Adiantum nelumboides]|nr:hypothetical protein [Adiantum nelumboides]